MKIVTYSLSIIIFLFFSKPLRSQDTLFILDKVYGLDQTLHNGKKYDYIAPPGTTGHQYFSSLLYSAGSVTLKGKCYLDITLNYDIFNQQLLLRYADEKYPWNVIEVSKAWLDGFSLGNKNFELLSLEQEPHIYQVLGKGSLRIMYCWQKKLNLNDVVGTYNYVFSPAIKDSFVFMNGQLKPFSSKRNLVRLFDPQHRQEIKSYLRRNKVKVKKASDQVMEEMITFIGNLK